MLTWLESALTRWLLVETPRVGLELEDHERLQSELQPADVILVEGRARVSRIIQSVTRSRWSHAALYVGRAQALINTFPALADQIVDGDLNANHPMLLEAELGQGVALVPLQKYGNDHLRLCRPKGLSSEDLRTLMEYGFSKIGSQYNLRQVMDLLRLLIPFPLLPRRWRSSLFTFAPGGVVRTICSSLIASCFYQVRYPIVPVLKKRDESTLILQRQNIRLLTPADFDASPYFEIIKYPVLGGEDLNFYRQLPWDDEGVICNLDGECLPLPAKPEE